MSRIPVAEKLDLTDQVRPVESFAEKVALVSQNTPKPIAALVTLHLEAVAIVNKLVMLVDRGGNSVLIDAAATLINRWNRDVREAAILVNKLDIQLHPGSNPDTPD